MVMLQKTYTPIAAVYFFPIIFIGSFFLLNLTLAVIKIKFSEEHKKMHQKAPKKKIKVQKKVDISNDS